MELGAVRVCTDCGESKSLEAFTLIGKPHYYGRCKACRARRAWERAHPGLRYADWVAERERVEWRTCTDCRQVKTAAEFVRVKTCRQGCYGRCRACRARRARERYQNDPLERERQKARVRRNRRRRRSAALPLAPP